MDKETMHLSDVNAIVTEKDNESNELKDKLNKAREDYKDMQQRWNDERKLRLRVIKENEKSIESRNRLQKNLKEWQKETEKTRKLLRAHEKFIGKKLVEIDRLKRQINCVKDHPEIKPLNCCWMADSLELRERRTG